MQPFKFSIFFFESNFLHLNFFWRRYDVTSLFWMNAFMKFCIDRLTYLSCDAPNLRTIYLTTLDGVGYRKKNKIQVKNLVINELLFLDRSSITVAFAFVFYFSIFVFFFGFLSTTFKTLFSVYLFVFSLILMIIYFSFFFFFLAISVVLFVSYWKVSFENLTQKKDNFIVVNTHTERERYGGQIF